MLLESDPETYSKPAYLHHAGWIRSTSALTKRTGSMSPAGSLKAGSLRRRGACWKQADDDDSREPKPNEVPLRWVTLGEAIAIAALIISAVGVWLS